MREFEVKMRLRLKTMNSFELEGGKKRYLLRGIRVKKQC